MTRLLPVLAFLLAAAATAAPALDIVPAATGPASADTALQVAKRGRGKDDGAGHVRQGRGSDDRQKDDRGGKKKQKRKGKRKSDDRGGNGSHHGPNHT